MQNYYKTCGKMSDTIILCLTEKGKIIGGYTPLTFIRTEIIKKDYNDFG
jgi:hypothetical protein